MRIDRWISIIVAGIFCVLVFNSGEVDTGYVRSSINGGLLAFALIGVVLIWLGDELGGFTGGSGRGRITQETPGCFIKLMGWVFLLGTLAMWLYQITAT